MDDTEFLGLIERARVGDDRAIRTLVAYFEDDLRIIVRARMPRSLRSRCESIDFVQEVWQSVFTSLIRDLEFSNIRHFRGFLAGVARNKVLEKYRNCTKVQKYDLNREEPLFVRRGDRELMREVAASDPSPSQDAQAHDRFAQLIAGRTPQEVEVIELRRSGLTFDEIALRTGMHERAVRRVIESIRERMEARKWR